MVGWLVGVGVAQVGWWGCGGVVGRVGVGVGALFGGQRYGAHTASYR